MRLIDAEEFQKFIEKQDESADYTIYHFEEWLEQQPTIEAKPVVHAHWLEQIIDGGQELMCSNCGEYALMNDEFYSEFSKYCPYCGAPMDEEINNG